MISIGPTLEKLSGHTFGFIWHMPDEGLSPRHNRIRSDVDWYMSLRALVLTPSDSVTCPIWLTAVKI